MLEVKATGLRIKDSKQSSRRLGGLLEKLMKAA